MIGEQALFERADRGSALSGAGPFFRFRFQALGTSNEILFAAPSRARAAAFREEALRWLCGFEARFSFFLEGSFVSRINAVAGGDWTATDADADELLALCDWYHWKTEGVFDPTAGPLLDLWRRAGAAGRMPAPGDVQAALALTGWRRVERERGRARLPVRGMRIDLGGIGKEYAADRLCAEARERGIADVLVNLGNDLRVSGSPPEGGAWRIGLEHPERPGATWSSVAVDEGGFCCSGDYLRFVMIGGVRCGHIVDPRTGYPARAGCRAAWVAAPSCTEAGVLSTAAVVVGAEEALRLIEGTPQAAGCVWADNGIHETRRFRHYETGTRKVG